APRMAEIRAIGLRASGRYVNRYDGSEFVRTIETLVSLPVALGGGSIVCGSAPQAPSSNLGLSDIAAPLGVELRWGKVAQDTGDPDGVLRYLVMRRPSGGAWTPIGIVEANGSGNQTAANRYAYRHPSVATGTFEYAVVAEGCGGVRSSPVTLGTTN